MMRYLILFIISVNYAYASPTIANSFETSCYADSKLAIKPTHNDLITLISSKGMQTQGNYIYAKTSNIVVLIDKIRLLEGIYCSANFNFRLSVLKIKNDPEGKIYPKSGELKAIRDSIAPLLQLLTMGDGLKIAKENNWLSK